MEDEQKEGWEVKGKRRGREEAFMARPTHQLTLRQSLAARELTQDLAVVVTNHRDLPYTSIGAHKLDPSGVTVCTQ